tara:strand:- start:845 stop:1063 length:219 start_codon:yes stop_codon:yes gene_type:complete
MKKEFEIKVQKKCMGCDCKYTHNLDAKYSKKMKEFVQYLGCCKEECFMKEPRSKRNRLMFGAFLDNLKDYYK